MMHQDKITNKNANSFFPVWLQKRELRQRLPMGHSDVLYKSLYSSILPCHSWSEGGSSLTGALLSLDFSPDGTLLVAGCEKKSFLMFDPLSRRLIHTVHNAHENKVTNVKFLNSRIFATGSVDETVSLWDTRNLKSRSRPLLRHSSTIGNIEFSRKTGKLITSEVNGSIHLWDPKNCNIREEDNSFMSHGHLRMRLNPDETKLVISTRSGHLLIIHELNLHRLAEDLNNTQLENFEQAYLHQKTYPTSQNWSHFLLQNRRRNRVEMVTDFPITGGCNVISALEIHPQEWSAFSRCTSDESKLEWTCVHDIQERGSSRGGAARRGWWVVKGPPCPQRLEMSSEGRCNVSGDGSTGFLRRTSKSVCAQSSKDPGSALPDAALPLERRAHKRRSGSPADTARARSPPSAPPDPLDPVGLESDPHFCEALDLSLPRSNPSVEQFNRRVYQRFPRLTHYIEEPYVTVWYIESLGVSADGRLVCSPLGHSIRLLTFSPEFSEQFVSWSGAKPSLLCELRTHTPHSDCVICTKFSPCHYLFVSGCSGGTLVWYQPVV